MLLCQINSHYDIRVVFRDPLALYISNTYAIVWRIGPERQPKNFKQINTENTIRWSKERNLWSDCECIFYSHPAFSAAWIFSEELSNSQNYFPTEYSRTPYIRRVVNQPAISTSGFHHLHKLEGDHLQQIVCFPYLVFLHASRTGFPCSCPPSFGGWEQHWTELVLLLSLLHILI